MPENKLLEHASSDGNTAGFAARVPEVDPVEQVEQRSQIPRSSRCFCCSSLSCSFPCLFLLPGSLPGLLPALCVLLRLALRHLRRCQLPLSPLRLSSSPASVSSLYLPASNSMQPDAMCLRSTARVGPIGPGISIKSGALDMALLRPVILAMRQLCACPLV